MKYNALTLSTVTILSRRVRRILFVLMFYLSIATSLHSFSPIDLSPVLWLDAKDSSSIAHSSNTVSQWNDKSVNNHHAILDTLGSGPTYDSVNNVIKFDGVDDLLKTADIDYGTDNKVSIYLVSTPESCTSGTRWIISKGTASADMDYTLAQLCRDSGGIFMSVINGVQGKGSLLTDGNTHLATQIVDGTNSELWTDGSLDTSAGSLSFSSNDEPVRLGGTIKSGALKNMFIGDIAELIILQKELSELDKAKMEGYLANKWNIRSNLPDTHTFKSIDFGVLSDQNLSIAENSATGASLGTLQAVGIDDHNFTNWEITEETTKYTQAMFTISASGELSINDNTQLDYEKTKRHVIKVRVYDTNANSGMGEWSSATEVTINITDISDGEVKTHSLLWGENGELWDPNGRLPDFSFAGYHAKNEDTPNIPVRINVTEAPYSADNTNMSDASDAIQSAVNTVSAAIADGNYSTGAIYLPAGTYRLEHPILIKQSGIVIKGAVDGNGKPTTIVYSPYSAKQAMGIDPDPLGLTEQELLDLWDLTPTSTPHTGDPGQMIRFVGTVDKKLIVSIDKNASHGDHNITVSNGTKVTPNGPITLQLTDPNQFGPLWQNNHNDQLSGWSDPNPCGWGTGSGYWTFWVESVNGNIVTLREPLPMNIRTEWTPKLKTFTGISEVGIENIRFEFFNPGTLREHLSEAGYNGVGFSYVTNAWAKNLEFLNADSGVAVTDESAWVSLKNFSFFGRKGHHGVSFNGSTHNLLDGVYFESTDILSPGDSDSDGDAIIDNPTPDGIDDAWNHHVTFTHKAALNVMMNISSGSDHPEMFIDFHRNGPMANLVTQTLSPWLHGSAGNTCAGPNGAARNTFWNMYGQGGEVERPGAPQHNWGYIQTNVINELSIGEQLTEERQWYEDISNLQPANIYTAQYARRNPNNIPTSADLNITIDEDTSKTFAENDFNFTDVDAGDELDSIYITTLESDGNLTLSGSEVILNQQITVANIPNLVFTPVANANGTPYTTFGFKVNDGEDNSSSEYTATVNVTAVDDAPVLDAITNQSQSEDFTDFNITLTSTDAEGTPISYTVGSSNPEISNVSIVDGKVVVTRVSNANGFIVVEVNATSNGLTDTQTFDLNITAVDDAPSFTSQQSSYEVNEDDPSYSVLLNATDVESDTFTFNAKASNSKVTISLTNDNNLTITPARDAHGTTTVDVNVTQDNNATLYSNYSFDVTINPVNDAPTITTAFADFSIAEDSGSSNYDLNVSDIEGEDVNVTIDSNNTSILQVNYTDFLDFNLSTVQDANGIVRISINVDDGDKNSTRSFDVNVTAVNDAPVLQDVGDQVKTEDFATYTLELNATDIDNSSLIYGALSNDTSKADVNVSGTTLSISSVANAFGIVSIDINVTDGNLSDTQSFNLNITAVDDAPVLVDINNAIVSEDFSDFNITLTSDDADTNNSNIMYTVGSSNPAIANVTIENGKVVVTPVGNAYGNIIIEVNATSNGLTDTQTFDLNITAVDDAPILATITDPTTKNEDFSDFNITLSASDIEGDSFEFAASSSTANINIIGTQLKISSIANGSGVVSIDVNVTQDSNSSLYDTQTITFTVNPLNDAPGIDTIFTDISILEDSGSSNYDLNVSDIDSTDLNITVDSNNTSILTVTQNWTNSLNQAAWTQTQDFNISTVADANGVARVTITVLDEDKNTTRSFDVNVTAVNDTPVLQDVMDQVKAEDFTAYTLELNAIDIDSSTLTYNATSSDTNKVTINVSGTTLTISSVANANGIVSIDINVTDGELSDTQSFDLNITPTLMPPPADSGQLLDSPADEIDTGLILDGTEDNETTITLSFTNEDNGTKSTIVIPKVEGEIISAIFSGDAIEFTLDDRIASYNNNGTTEHSMVVDNKATVVISYLLGTLVEFNNDGSIQTSIDYSGSGILILSTPTGESLNSITNSGGVQTKADSTIPGTQTVIDNDGDIVIDTPSILSDLGNEITTKTTLDSDGNAVVSAVKVLPDGTIEDIPLGGYGEGSEVKVQHINGSVVVEVIMSLGTQSFTLRSGRR